MADSNVEVTEGAGKRVDTRTTPGGDHRQVIVLGDPDSDVVINASDITSLITSVRDYLDTVETKLQSLIDNTDGLEGFTDGVETLLTSVRDYVDQLEGYVDGLEGGIGAQADIEAVTGNGSLIAIAKNLRTRLAALEGYLDTAETKLQSIIDVEGALGDAAVTTDSSGTISGKLRGLIKWAFERMPASLGQKTKAGSLPITLASDEDVIDVLDTNSSSIKTALEKLDDTQGTWGYNAGTSGTLVVAAGRRILQITAVSQEGAASLTINGGDTITLPYGSTDKVSSAITIEPKGNLVAPTIIFTDTDGYFVEWVSG